MLDAEIAAILLNRRDLDDEAAGDLLREGNLQFVAEAGRLGPATPRDTAPPTVVECLLFGDGSRAFRVGGVDVPRRWTKWAVVEPFAGRETPDGARDHARRRPGPQWA